MACSMRRLKIEWINISHNRLPLFFLFSEHFPMRHGNRSCNTLSTSLCRREG